MIPGMNQKAMKQAMKKMGMKQEVIPAEEVIIRSADKELIVRNPEVVKVVMMGQESLQITGDIQEYSRGASTEDVNTVVEQTGCSESEAKAALEESHGDLAEAIMAIQAKEEES